MKYIGPVVLRKFSKTYSWTLCLRIFGKPYLANWTTIHLSLWWIFWKLTQGHSFHSLKLSLKTWPYNASILPIHTKAHLYIKIQTERPGFDSQSCFVLYMIAQWQSTQSDIITHFRVFREAWLNWPWRKSTRSNNISLKDL